MITSEKTHGLTDEEMTFYEQNGYVLAKGAFTREEATLFREETHALAHRLLLLVSAPSIRRDGLAEPRWSTSAGN